MNYKYIFCVLLLLPLTKSITGMELKKSYCASAFNFVSSNPEKRPQIFSAIHSGNLDKVKEIIDDVDTYDQLNIRFCNRSPLRCALFNSKNEIAVYLIEMGANLDNALFSAQSADMVKILIAVGDDVTQLNNLKKNRLNWSLKSISCGVNSTVEMDVALELIRHGVYQIWK